MAKFKKQPDEQILMKGTLSWLQGEASVGNFLKGKYKVTECQAFLTTQRFATCKKFQRFPFGPLIWLILWMMGRNIVFELPLSNIASVDGGEQKGQLLTLKALDGTEYKLNTVAFTSKKKQQWVQAISDAVVTGSPARAAVVKETVVEFS